MSLGKMSLSFPLASMHISFSESFAPELFCINIALLINGSVPWEEMKSEGSESKSGLSENIAKSHKFQSGCSLHRQDVPLLIFLLNTG